MGITVYFFFFSFDLIFNVDYWIVFFFVIKSLFVSFCAFLCFNVLHLMGWHGWNENINFNAKRKLCFKRYSMSILQSQKQKKQKKKFEQPLFIFYFISFIFCIRDLFTSLFFFSHISFHHLIFVNFDLFFF